MSLTKEEKNKLIGEFKIHESDTGSTEVQIAMLTKRIRQLTEHLKIHKHDEKPPRGYGLFHAERLCVFYTYECNLGDGWADADIHNDPPKKREDALKMGVNIIVWALTN